MSKEIMKRFLLGHSLFLRKFISPAACEVWVVSFSDKECVGLSIDFVDSRKGI